VVGTTVACLTLCYVGLLAGRMVMAPR